MLKTNLEILNTKKKLCTRLLGELKGQIWYTLNKNEVESAKFKTHK